MLGIFASVAVHMYLLKPPRELRDTAVTKAQAVQIWREAKSIIRKTGAKVELKRFRQINPHWSAKAYYSDVNMSQAFYVDVFVLARDMKIRPKNGIQHFIVPRSMGGYMYGACLFDVCGPDRRAISYATAQERNILGADRHRHSVLATVHEMLHGLGAKHSESGVMASGILYSLDSTISETTKAEVKQCLRRRNA